MTIPDTLAVSRPARRILGVPTIGSAAWFSFYLIPPLMLALPLGLNSAGIGAEMTRPASVLIWALVCMTSWWLSDLFSRFVGWSLRGWQPWPWLLIVSGFLLNVAASSLYCPWLLAGFLQVGLVDVTPVVRAYFLIERDLTDLAYLRALFIAALPGLPFWLLGNYFLERFYGLPRLSRLATALAGETSEDSADDSLATAELSTDAASAPKPRFLQRLDRLAGLNVSELVAVEAEDHYIHVHSRRGKELVYYRFGDALEELRTLRGIQIHRSAWVSIDGIQAVEDRGRKTHVVLITGERLRVSLPNRVALLRLRQASAPA
ncbi:MAG: LytTR family DNA-binding domain-containing protein [Steroidobacteraceae bacterium]|nr:LytTR family DNA-binding domain-containing protein [Steroidobacteraceae bacterium]